MGQVFPGLLGAAMDLTRALVGRVHFVLGPFIKLLGLINAGLGFNFASKCIAKVLQTIKLMALKTTPTLIYHME